MIKGYLTIDIYEDLGLTSPHAILESLGYKEIQTYYDESLGKYNGKAQYQKDGKTYVFRNWSHFNSYIEQIHLARIE